MTSHSSSPIRYSVVVPTIGRIDFLTRCLQNLAQVDPPEAAWEVLIMDTSGATDNLRMDRLLERFHGTIPNLRFFRLPREGLMLGRHRGCIEANGEILSFIDDDSLVDPIWLRGIETAFADSQIAMAGGPCLPLYESPPSAWLEYFWETDGKYRFLLDLSLLQGPDTPCEVHPSMIWGCNLSIRKQVFRDVGGTHPDCLTANLQRYQGDGETALSIRLAAAGKRALHHPAISIRHFIPAARVTRESFAQRAFYQGVCDSFTNLRRSHGIGPAQGVPLRDQSLMGQFRKIIWNAEKMLRGYWNAALSTSKPKREASSIRRTQQKEYARGYRFHQREVRKDPELLEWVLRDNYLDCGGIPRSDLENTNMRRNG